MLSFYPWSSSFFTKLFIYACVFCLVLTNLVITCALDVVLLSIFFYPQQIALEMKVNKNNLFIIVDIDSMNVYIVFFFFFHIYGHVRVCLDVV